MIPARGETYYFEVRKRKENSAYEYEENVSFGFFGRPANQIEKKNYRIQKGVNGNTDSVFILSTNLPENIDIKDKVYFLGKEWTVESIGYYFESNRIVNARIMSDKQIADRCPKGINLQ